MSLPRPLLLILLLLTAARWLLGAGLELSGDEAYYLLWSRHLDWSYYSKGPGIAVAMWLSTSVLGDSAGAVRFLSPLCALGSSVLAWKLAARLFSRRSALWGVLLLNATPIFNVGSVVFTIDALMILAWLAAMYAFWRAIESEQGNARAWPWWLACGLALAGGFLAKYTTFVLLPSFVGWLIWPGEHRTLWRRPGPWLMLGAALLGLLPVAIWNSANEWITVTHLLERGKIGESTGLNPLYVLEYFAHHLGVYSPLICLGSFASIWLAWRAARNGSRGDAFLLVCSLPIVAGYFALSLKEPGEDNWTAPGMLGLGLLFAHHLAESALTPRRRTRWLLASAVTGMAMVLLLLSSDLFRAAGLPWPWSRDVTGRLRGHDQAAAVVVELAETEFGEGHELFLIANKWQVAANLDHALSRAGDPLELLRPSEAHPRVHMESKAKIVNQYSFWPRYDQHSHPAPGVPSSEFLGADALYLIEAERRYAPDSIQAEFEQVQPLGRITLRRHGLPIRSWSIFACRRYRGGAL